MIREEITLHEAAQLPYNIEKFAKENGVLKDVKQLARWAKKAGLQIVGGTAIGKGYSTLILDLTYNGAEIYLDMDTGRIKVNRQPVNSWKTFSKAVSVNESSERLSERDGKHKSRNDKVFKKLVKISGKSTTVEGEMLRAINKILYRYYNDGDKFFEGYGTETAGPAATYLLRSKGIRRLGGDIRSTIMKYIFKLEDATDKTYEKLLDKMLDVILTHIENTPEEEYTKNKEDMHSFDSKWEDYDDDEMY